MFQMNATKYRDYANLLRDAAARIGPLERQMRAAITEEMRREEEALYQRQRREDREREIAHHRRLANSKRARGKKAVAQRPETDDEYDEDDELRLEQDIANLQIQDWPGEGRGWGMLPPPDPNRLGQPLSHMQLRAKVNELYPALADGHGLWRGDDESEPDSMQDYLKTRRMTSIKESLVDFGKRLIRKKSFCK